MKEGSPEYEATIHNLATNIGRVRNLFGDKTPADHPGRVAETVGHIRHWLHLGGKSQSQLQADAEAKRNAWNAENATQAQEYATGAINPLQMEVGELTGAGFSPEAARSGLAYKMGLVPKSSKFANFVSPDGKHVVAVDENSPEAQYYAQQGYTLQIKPSASLLPKVNTGAGGIPESITDPTNSKVWTPATIKDAPPNIQQQWDSAQSAYKANIAHQDQVRKQQEAFEIKRMGMMYAQESANQERAFKDALSEKNYAGALKMVNAQKQSYITALGLEDRLKQLAKTAYNADGTPNQQAMFALLTTHLAMTLGLVKGARLNRTTIEEAIKSRPTLAGIAVHWNPTNWHLSGVVLTPEQIKQMVDLGPVTVKAQKNLLQQAQDMLSDDFNVQFGKGPNNPYGPVHQHLQRLKSDSAINNALGNALNGVQ